MEGHLHGLQVHLPKFVQCYFSEKIIPEMTEFTENADTFKLHITFNYNK